MILGVDHIALSADEIDGAVRELATLGFTARFLDYAVYNHPAKRPFVRAFTTEHAMAYCTSGRPGVAIEVTVHGEPPGIGEAGYRILLASVPTAPTRTVVGGVDDPCRDWWHRVGAGPATVMPCPRLRTTYWIARTTTARSRDGARVQGLMVFLDRLDESLGFWTRGLGLALEAGEPSRWAHLRPSTALPQWTLDVFLVAATGSAAKREWYLDDAGFPCLAFVTNDVERDRARLREYGAAETGEVFEISVSERTVRACIARGPSGEPIELIEVLSKRAGERRR